MKSRKLNLIIATTVILFTSQIIYAQIWEEIGFNLPDGQIASSNSQITFANKDTGWLYNEFYIENFLHKQLYKTTDGGENWQRVSLNNVKNFSGAIIFSMKPDFFCLINSDYYRENPSDVLFTRDGGNTWTYKQIVNDGYKAIHFFDEDKGIIVGGHSWITSDGGLTWLRGGEITLPEDVYFHDENHGWAVGYGPTGNDVSYVAETKNGGNTWEYIDYPFSILSGVTFIDSFKGFVVGAMFHAAFYQTTDGGKNWQIDTTFEIGGFDIEFLDNKNGWISSWGQILKTTDGGYTWNRQFDNYINYRLVKLIMLKEDKTAYILGVNPDSNSATLFKADLSNITGVEENMETIPEEFYLLQNYPNPFNPTTTIEYRIPKESYVALKVYDMLGKEITTLVNERKLPGTYKINFDGSRLTSGVYVARLTTGKFDKSIKLILTK